MKRARIIVLAIAIPAALGAAWIAKKIVSGPREVQQVEKTVGATDVLFTAKNIGLGDSVRSDDLKWQQWPVEGVTPGLITREAQPDAPSEFSGAVAREGCATQRNLAAMVANPEDLLYPARRRRVRASAATSCWASTSLASHRVEMVARATTSARAR